MNYEKLVRIRKLSKAVLLLTIFGMLGELLLIGHYNDVWQIIPIIYLLFTLVSVILLSRVDHNKITLIARCLSYGLMLLGAIGVGLHLKNNYAFEAEMYPTESFSSLFIKSFSGALPVLAPGSLIPLGLIIFLSINLKTINH